MNEEPLMSKSHLACLNGNESKNDIVGGRCAVGADDYEAMTHFHINRGESTFPVLRDSNLQIRCRTTSSFQARNHDARPGYVA